MKSTPSRRTAVVIAVVLAAGMVVGVAGPAQAALPPGPSTTGVTGARPSATLLKFPISDQILASVDVATGNLLVTATSLSLVGVTGPVRISQSYNSQGTSLGSTSIPPANLWTVGIDGAGYLSQGTGVVIYTAGDGATWAFTPVSGSSTAFTSPAGLKADLVASGTNYTLTDRTSRQVVTFNLNGQPTSIADRNGNATTIGYTGLNPTSIVASAGPVAARTASLTYNAGTFTLTACQTSGTSSRSVQYVKNSSSDLVSIIDAEGKTTSFTYLTGSKLSTITSPTGGVTTFSYSSGGIVSQVSRTNTTTGSPGTSVTRITYPSTTQTLVAGPDTNQSNSVASEPHTTYTIDATRKLAIKSVDPLARERAATYTTQADVATATDGTGASAGTTTAAYGANGGNSRTSVQSPTGATSTAAYANTATATKYLPSSTTGDSSGTSAFTYDGAGNALTSTDSMTNVATLTYNTDGTLATALAPGNGTNKTIYAYDTNKQLSTVTPVTGGSLGVRTFTYDDFGRVKTATDGRGITLTYSYDKQDRLLTTSFSDSTPTVTNTYTDVGQPKTRVDGNGTTTYAYDQLNRLISRVNTFGGGTISYAYDKASNLISTTDSRGTTTNHFDASGVVTDMVYNNGGSTQTLGFATDNRGRRTDSWLQTNVAHTVWSAHTRQDFDINNRVARSVAETMSGGTVTVTFDTSYCYNTGSAAPTCGTTMTNDRSKLQWEKDNLTGRVTNYSYDGAGRLTGAAQSGGSGGNNTYSYTYDARGNRLTAVVTGSTPSSQTFTANAANQISSTGYTFDGTGNMTADPAGTYAYNGAEQMKTVTQGASVYTYKYAGTSQNEVLQQQKSGTTYQLTYGRNSQIGQPVLEQIKIGTATAYVENDPVTGQPLMLRTSTGSQALYVYNGTGSPVALLTDASTQSYAYQFDPYGVAVITAGGGGTGSVQNPFLFAGGIQDRATGWVHFGARWYNPTTGRWTQQDTLDNPLDPSNANRYAYAGNDPVNFLDPTGRAFGTTCAVLAGVLGGISFAAGIVSAVAGVVAAPVTAGVSTAATVGGIALIVGVSTGAPAAILGGLGIFGEC